MEEIIRNFEVMRGERKIVYPFTTFPFVFQQPSNSILKKVYGYLAEVFTKGCPAFEGKISASNSSPIILNVEERKSNLVEFAKAADYRKRGAGQHLCVQRYLLENDPSTIAIEIPVWNKEYSGHIDVLRIFPDCIEIVDFKPEAGKEKNAASQLFRYRAMLAERLALPLSQFRCVYFNDKYAYYLT